jgi:hypothetical protein
MKKTVAVEECVELLEDLLFQGYEGKDLIEQFAEQFDDRITCPICRRADRRGYKADLLPSETLEAIAESDAIFRGEMPGREFKTIGDMYKEIEESIDA